MLSPDEVAARNKGQTLKKYIRAYAALNNIFDDVGLAEIALRNRAAVGKWWTGARPEPEVVTRLARELRVSQASLFEFVYDDGPPPDFPAPLTPEPGSPAAASIEEGDRRARSLQQPVGHDKRPPKPARPSRGSGARHE